MTTRNREEQDERALRTIEAICGGPEDVDLDRSMDHAAVARIRIGIDQAFDLAWKAARAKAKADRAETAHAPGLLAQTRDALLAKIQQWQDALGPSLQLAHRQLDTMDDDDLRTLLADIEEVVARKGAAP